MPTNYKERPAPKSYMKMMRINGSSNVRSIGYSKRNQELGIRFHSSPKRYLYSDVPYSVYQEMINAPSKGKYVWQNIRGMYPYRTEGYTGQDYEMEEIMPATSQAQQRYFGWLYSKKKSGDTSGMTEKDIKALGGMSMDQIRDYAATKRSTLPVVVQKAATACMDIYKTAGDKSMKAPIVFMEKVAISYDRIVGAIGKRVESIKNANPKLQGYLANTTNNQLYRMDDGSGLVTRIGKGNYRNIRNTLRDMSLDWRIKVRGQKGQALLNRNEPAAVKLQTVIDNKLMNHSDALKPENRDFIPNRRSLLIDAVRERKDALKRNI